MSRDSHSFRVGCRSFRVLENFTQSNAEHILDLPMANQPYASLPSDPDQLTTPSAADMKKKELLDEQGGTGTVIINGYLSKQDYNPDFTGTKRIDIYHEMRLSDATVRAAMLAVKSPYSLLTGTSKNPAATRRRARIVAALLPGFPAFGGEPWRNA